MGKQMFAGETQLRPYQQRALNQLYAWFDLNKVGNPCVVLPTGSGKSHVIAALCKDALEFPDQRILMLTHQKELIEQDVEKLLMHFHDAPVGIYSASVGRKEIDAITFAGIQSVRGKAKQIGKIDLVVVDEAHLVSHKEEGTYRNLISDLLLINPDLRVVGFTATPWRLGHGDITQGSALFDALIEPVSIHELQNQGYLSMLRSKATVEKLCTDGIHTRGGEYIESELQKAVMRQGLTELVVSEVLKRAGERKFWLFFCSGVAHAEETCDTLVSHGIVAACVTGETSKVKREQILADFRSGKLQAITNANVLTTGFDHPGIDLIVMMRPTLSPTLYMQMVGRGLRTSEGKEDCLVLDFAGNVARHGPVTNIKPPKEKKAGDGVAPCKICPACDEIVFASARVCPGCGHEFAKKEKDLWLREDDISGKAPIVMESRRWFWRIHVGRESGKEMLAVSYYGSFSDASIVEYLTVFHDGYPGVRAMGILNAICHECGVDMLKPESPQELVQALNLAPAPTKIMYHMQGRYPRIVGRSWEDDV